MDNTRGKRTKNLDNMVTAYDTAKAECLQVVGIRKSNNSKECPVDTEEVVLTLRVV